MAKGKGKLGGDQFQQQINILVDRYGRKNTAALLGVGERHVTRLAAGHRNPSAKVYETVREIFSSLPRGKQKPDPGARVQRRVASRKVARDENGFKIMQGRVQYQKVDPRLTPIYNSKYSYVMGYQVRGRDGILTTKYLTITSHAQRTKAQVKEVMSEILNSNRGKYESDKVLKGSFYMVSAFYNPAA